MLEKLIRLLPYLEYGLMPCFLVVITVAVKQIIKHSERDKWFKSLFIGIDIMLTCTFAILIYGISIHNHLHKNIAALEASFFCLLIGFFSFCVIIVIALFIKGVGEYSGKSFWMQNLIGVIYIVSLFYGLSQGKELFAEKDITSRPPQLTIESDTLKIK